jgi:uncharacterized protein YndB with AHSA1/START domain
MGALKLAARSEREIVAARVFDAPPAQVFAAWTKPDLLKRWLYGPEEWPLAVCKIDFRVGGAVRMVWRHRDGREMGMSAVYREIAPPIRLLCTELWDEDWTGGETLAGTVLTEDAGKTALTQTLLYTSRAARDAVLETPWKEGMAQSYDRLARLLASMPA